MGRFAFEERGNRLLRGGVVLSLELQFDEAETRPVEIGLEAQRGGVLGDGRVELFVTLEAKSKERVGGGIVWSASDAFAQKADRLLPIAVLVCVLGVEDVEL